MSPNPFIERALSGLRPPSAAHVERLAAHTDRPSLPASDEISMPFKSHDEYIATQPENLRGRLEQIQQEVERQVPGSTRTISYNLPAFKKENMFFYFAAFKKHIGIYPPVTEDAELIKETEALRGPKGNLSLSHDAELPLQLIGRVAKALASQAMKDRLVSQGAIPSGANPLEFAAFMDAEIKKWAVVVKNSGAKID